MTHPKPQWMSASPLWQTFSSTPAALRKPVLLRFVSDTFMEDLQDLLQRDPARLTDFIAQKESFREKPPGAPVWQPQTPVLKLYQPAHGHFSLVAASLVCRMPGLPDHSVNPATREKAAFLLRRIGPSGEEMAWVDQAGRKQWLPLNATQAECVADGEELHPLFPMNFTQGPAKRRLLAGLVPTASRETLQAAAAISPLDSSNDPDPRIEEVNQRVFTAWSDLQKNGSRQTVDQRVEVSRFVLLDFADFLATRLPALWNAISAATPPPFGTALYNQINTLTVPLSSGGSMTLRAALIQALSEWDRITGESSAAPSLSVDLFGSFAPSTLQTPASQALAATPATGARGPDPEIPKLDAGGVTYVIRCAYQRPACPRDCGVLSPPTEQFSLAAFFDPDAPARTIRIELPVDTSLAGLRKFKKNVAFMISDKLRGQMSAVNDAAAALKGDIGGGDSFNLGELCSFSIPIITLCAFLVLMIFLILLNIVFWWLPLLRICFPLKLKAR